MLALGALSIHRRPELLALAAAAALPFRVPIESGGDTANLLVPLYIVIAAGVLAYALPRLRAPRGLETRAPTTRGAPRARAAGMAAGRRVRPLRGAGDVLERLRRRARADDLLLRPVRAALRAAGADPLDGAAGRPLPDRPARAGAGFVGIGFVEYAKRELLLNPKVISSNQFESYFRVNSLFFDPNIYGRFLVTVMLGLVAVLLWSRGRRSLRAARRRWCCFGRGSR